MSIQSEITRINTAVANSITAISNVGGSTSSVTSVGDLPTAISALNTMQNLTLAQYESLSTTEQNNGTLYVIVE